jgi:hypothetical protein
VAFVTSFTAVTANVLTHKGYLVQKVPEVIERLDPEITNAGEEVSRFRRKISDAKAFFEKSFEDPLPNTDEKEDM